MQREKILQKRKTSELLVFTFPNTDTANKTSTLPLLVSAGCRKNSEKRKTQLLYRSFSCDDLWVNQTKQSMNVNKSGVSIPAQNPTKNTQVRMTSILLICPLVASLLSLLASSILWEMQIFHLHLLLSDKLSQLKHGCGLVDKGGIYAEVGLTAMPKFKFW